MSERPQERLLFALVQLYEATANSLTFTRKWMRV